MVQWNLLLEQVETTARSPLRPQMVIRALSDLLDDDAVISLDCGANTHFAARFLRLKSNQRFTVTGMLASMACGLPYANAAALAYPDRPVVALVGDGGLSMLMAELSTSAKYDLNVKIIVLKNNSLGQIKWEQMAFLGNPEYGCDLQPIDYAGVARAYGIRGYSIVDSNHCQGILAEAFTEDGPALIEATVDPNEPPLPPKVSFAQTRHMVEALIRGTPEQKSQSSSRGI
jgi:pyruvate dehydrogenase (quinone)/pyruvate oxidase